MKNLLVAFILAVSIQAFGQESALLRLNYNEGDVYEIKVTQNQSTGIQGGTDMTILMDMAVTDASDQIFKTESKITSIVMNMSQGGMSMSYDSSQSDEELDATGKMLKSQLSPMMNATILNSYDVYAKTLETKSEPPVPGIDQFTQGQSNIKYPEEKVSVGSSWTSENENQGMKVSTTYTVSKIADGMVYLDIQGDVTGAGTGTLKGTSEIEISTGTAKSSNTEITVAAQGVEVSVVSNVQMTKK